MTAYKDSIFAEYYNPSNEERLELAKLNFSHEIWNILKIKCINDIIYNTIYLALFYNIHQYPTAKIPILSDLLILEWKNSNLINPPIKVIDEKLLLKNNSNQNANDFIKYIHIILNEMVKNVKPYEKIGISSTNLLYCMQTDKENLWFYPTNKKYNVMNQTIY